MAAEGRTNDRELVTDSEKALIHALDVTTGVTTSNELADGMDITTDHVRRCLKSLGERGVVETEQSPEDARLSLHRLGEDVSPSDFISNREEHLSAPCRVFTDSNGYEQARSWLDGEYDNVPIHRLVAVAEYGFDAVAGNEVHHLKAIPWANWGENLVPMAKTDHLSNENDRDLLDVAIARVSADELGEGLERAGHTEAAAALITDGE
jgi:DNA-binding IscR family transcriptional regulator